MSKSDGGGSPDISDDQMSIRKVCVMCGKRKGDQMLLCAEIGCPIALHVKCFPCEPKFDQSGKFFCPYCSYKRATAKVKEMKKKALLAKRALLNFVDAGVAGHSKKEQNQANASASINENEGNDVVPPKETGSPVEEVPCLREQMGDAKGSSPPKQSSKKQNKVVFPNARRKRINWTLQEEEMLLEGVRRFSDNENKNLPWRKILEFGSGTFDSTRTPVDLKDKWRNMQKKI